MKKEMVPTLACGVALLMSGCSSSMTDGSMTGSAATATAPKAYVGLFGDNAVAVVDTGTNQVMKTIPVPTGPNGLVITPDGSKVYVSSDGSTTVSVISTSTDSVVNTIQVGMTPHGLSISKDGTKILLSDFGGDQAEVINPANDSLVAMIAVTKPHNSAISPDGTRAYEASQATMPAIAVLDMIADTVITTVALTAAPRALDYAPTGTVYFTLTGVDALERLDPATNRLGTPIPTGGSPHHMVATKDGAYELVVSQTAGDIEYVDPVSATVVAKVPTGTTPHWIALSSDGKYAYVTDEGSNDLAIVDIAAKSVVRTIAVGKGPRKVAVQAVGQ
jgi:YVTN family beta-propeller protein